MQSGRASSCWWPRPVIGSNGSHANFTVFLQLADGGRIEEEEVDDVLNCKEYWGAINGKRTRKIV